VAKNPEVVLVDPLDVDSIADGLARALAMESTELGRARRRDSVAALTWANSALDHLAGWR
jgi:glycosyltransferase involved in cell wall biosynthesis